MIGLGIIVLGGLVECLKQQALRRQSLRRALVFIHYTPRDKSEGGQDMGGFLKKYQMRDNVVVVKLSIIVQNELLHYKLTQILLRLILILPCGFGLLVSCSGTNRSFANDGNRLWAKEKFTVATMPTAERKAMWELRQEGNFDLPIVNLPLDKAESVLAEFSKLPKGKQAFGIFIYSKSFAIPNNSEERQYMGEHLWKRYNDKAWRESESQLINDLRLLCNDKNITLYVNLSVNLQGHWKALTSPNNVELSTGQNRMAQ